MKRTFSLFLFWLLLFSGELSAQNIPQPQNTSATAFSSIQRGNWLVGADLGSIGQNFKSKTFNFSVQPRAGYFVSDNAVLGAQIQLGFNSVKGGGNTFIYGLTPFARYYFPEGATPTHRWFGEALAGIGGTTYKNDDIDPVVSAVYGVRAGYAHFVASNVSLEGTLNLTRSHADIDVGNAQTGLSLGFAFQIYLPGRGNR
ncbi:hypothetical protein HUW51_12935 [Adhaeribacter swui]|uniref:Outer membrane beta-barrel protein n=1 Tax=Adhaeribacter swui TaxID=2086471 RepID=A0A7G7G8U7_9BACT|nr:hypothetical protein [Adhaeribacter swui]QNF33581.1 hypothetical protein HUW51_12935 [Adhaeribacter swui]